MMNIEIVKILLDIRDNTIKFRQNVIFNEFPFIVWHCDINKRWDLPNSFSKIIEDYFPYDGEFVAWLCHKVDNLEFEKEIQRYLNLKAFI